MLTWLFENERKKEITKQKFGEAIISRLIDDVSLNNTDIGTILQGYKKSLSELDTYINKISDELSDKDNQRTLEAKQIKAKEQFDWLYNTIWNNLVRVDPSPEKQCKYVPWIVNRYLNGGIRLWEDLGRTKIALDKHFDMITRRVFQNMDDDNSHKPFSDINKFLQLNMLETFIREIENQNKDAIDQDFIKNVKNYSKNGGLDLVWSGNNSTTFIVKLNKVEASSALFAQRTGWCTAPKDNSYFDSYSEDGPLYAFADIVHGWYYQLHPGSRQFMDKDDEQVRTIEEFPFTHEMWLAYVNHIFGVSLQISDKDALKGIIETIFKDDYSLLVNNIGDTDIVIYVLRTIYKKYYPNVSSETLNDYSFMFKMICLMLDKSRNIDHDEILVSYGNEQRFIDFIEDSIRKNFGIPSEHQMNNQEISSLWYTWVNYHKFKARNYIVSGLKVIGRDYEDDVSGTYGIILRNFFKGEYDSTLSDTAAAHYIRHSLLRTLDSDEFIRLVGDDPTINNLILNEYPFKDGRNIRVANVTDLEFAKHLYKVCEYTQLKNITSELINTFGPDHPDMKAMMNETIQMKHGFIPSTALVDVFLAITGARNNQYMVSKYPRGSKLYEEFRDNLHKTYTETTTVIDDRYIMGFKNRYLSSWYNKLSSIKGVKNSFLNAIDKLAEGDLPSYSEDYYDNIWQAYIKYIDIFIQSNGKSLIEYFRKTISDSNNGLRDWNYLYDIDLYKADDDYIMDFIFKEDDYDIRRLITRSYINVMNGPSYAAAVEAVEDYLANSKFKFVVSSIYNNNTYLSDAKYLAINGSNMIGDIRKPEAKEQDVYWVWASTREDLNKVYDAIMKDTGYALGNKNMFDSDIRDKNIIGKPFGDIDYPDLDPDALRKEWNRQTKHLLK